MDQDNGEAEASEVRIQVWAEALERRGMNPSPLLISKRLIKALIVPNLGDLWWW